MDWRITQPTAKPTTLQFNKTTPNKM